MNITEGLVDSAFSIEPKDMAYIERLVMLQDRHASAMSKAI